MNGAAAGDDQQYPPVVLVNNAWVRVGAAGFTGRVGAEPRRRLHFLCTGKHLQQQGVLWVAPPHARHEGARNTQREGLPRCLTPSQCRGGDLQGGTEFSG